MKYFIWAFLLINLNGAIMLFPMFGEADEGVDMNCRKGIAVQIPKGLDYEGFYIRCEDIREFNVALEADYDGAKKFLLKPY